MTRVTVNGQEYDGATVVVAIPAEYAHRLADGGRMRCAYGRVWLGIGRLFALRDLPDSVIPCPDCFPKGR